MQLSVTGVEEAVSAEEWQIRTDLAAQSLDDEPAGALLERIQVEPGRCTVVGDKLQE